jgi:hypothetical protein
VPKLQFDDPGYLRSGMYKIQTHLRSVNNMFSLADGCTNIFVSRPIFLSRITSRLMVLLCRLEDSGSRSEFILCKRKAGALDILVEDVGDTGP